MPLTLMMVATGNDKTNLLISADLTTLRRARNMLTVTIEHLTLNRH
jgi:hypothetical protein